MSKWRYVLTEPILDAADEEALLDCIRSGSLTMGPRTRDLEIEFAKQHAVNHAIAVSSGTAAIHLALLALDIGASPKDEVIQPSLNFVAAANMTMAVGARPVFVDIVSFIEPTISPAKIEDRISARTKAVIVMHYGGYPARMTEISRLCHQYDIALIEDARHAPGQRVPELGNRALGTIGDIGCFSFFPDRNPTCGEGGMVVTNNDDLAVKLRALRSHGMTVSSEDWQDAVTSCYDVTRHGFNYRIDDLRAALAMTQLLRLNRINERRRSLAERYAYAVHRFAGGAIQFVNGMAPRAGAAHIAAILVDADIRDALREHLAAVGIQSSCRYPPVHAFSAFGSPCDPLLPITTEYSRRMIALPLDPKLPDYAPEEIIRICIEFIDANVRHSTSARDFEYV